MNGLSFKSFTANRPDKDVGLSKFYSGINYLQSHKNVCNRLQTEKVVYCIWMYLRHLISFIWKIIIKQDNSWQTVWNVTNL